jgi:hypothetical protein
VRHIVAPSLLCVAAACAEDPPPPGPYIESHVDYWEFPTAPPSELDILIVVDDTPAMAAHRSKVLGLATALEATLFGETGVFFDTRIAVTTAGATGVLRTHPDVVEPFLVSRLDAHYDLTANFAGSLDDALAPLLDVGAAGSDAVAPLAAGPAALDGEPAFLREHSLLSIITIASTDDASPGAPLDHAGSLKERRDDPANIFVSAAYPIPSTRLDTFHEAFPNRNAAVDIASSDWTSMVMQLAWLRRSILGAACVRIPGDLAPAVPGLQQDCVVEARYHDGTSEILPWCIEGDPARCFEIVEDPVTCTFEADGRLRVRGYPGGYSPTIRGQCVVF